MPLIPTRELLAQARAAGRGLPAFNVIHLESAEAILGGAEDAGLPVILQISENAATYHGGLAPIARGTLAAVERSGARAALHLDHAEDPALVEEALSLGFTSVMFDAARLADEENRRLTERVCARAHAAGVLVEAELGEVGGKDGAHAPGVRTDPAEAARFVADTGVDALAVAVGSSHAMTQRTAALDLGLISRLREAVPVPLVLHGSSGVADAHLQEAVLAGMTKINVSTHLNKVFTARLRQVLEEHPEWVDSRKYLGPARQAMRAEVARLAAVIVGPGA
ncbi:class II fructose-bisphosphate aldolase [Galactobacter caseinivorans]|uniref:Class II fructose-bisphosphate aldolase n=1 Tax=Galactobacter caseinivorans TaxID=2676123 RepID=A0A496PGG8_9MICC|nr:class II fructose-bisphosphate aldolase [Galactobacter caseinivorans]RKW69575.1 class II fructose-bisphosphate aldolase [Galactobacter caseinivorans]